MKKTICLVWAASLLLVFNAGGATAQEESDRPALDRPAGRPGRTERGFDAPQGMRPGWTAPPTVRRLEELEAKLDTLLNEVRQLRREIQRQRADMQPGPRGPQYAPWPRGGGYRGGYGFYGPPAPWGPGFGGPPWARPHSDAPRQRDADAPRDRNADRDRDVDAPRKRDRERDADAPRERDRERDADAPRERKDERGPDRPQS